MKSIKKFHVIILYRSPSNTPGNLFLTTLEDLLADISSPDPHFRLLLDNFTAKSETWFTNDQSAIEKTELPSLALPQSAFTCSKLTIKTLEQVVKYIQS